MKLIRIMVSAVCLSMGLSFTSYCGEWKQDNNGWWYAEDDGSYIKDNWFKEGNNWYYFNSDGYMSTGWLKNNDKWYYMDESGVMLKNTVVDGVQLAFDGSILTATRSKDKNTVTDKQKRAMDKAIASFVDFYVDKNGTDEGVVYKKDDFAGNSPGLLFNVLRHIDSHELFSTKRGFKSETDSDFTYSAVSVDEALDVLNGLYACDFTKDELLECVKSLQNSGRGFFTFENSSYISKEGIFAGNPIPKVEVEKYELRDGYLKVSGKVTATACDKCSGETLKRTYSISVGFDQNPGSVSGFTMNYISLK